MEEHWITEWSDEFAELISDLPAPTQKRILKKLEELFESYDNKVGIILKKIEEMK